MSVHLRLYKTGDYAIWGCCPPAAQQIHLATCYIKVHVTRHPGLQDTLKDMSKTKLENVFKNAKGVIHTVKRKDVLVDLKGKTITDKRVKKELVILIADLRFITTRILTSLQ
jgi:hypothetical protein